MACIYRYTDLADGIIKYVGIVYGETRTLKNRLIEHLHDEWYKYKNWKIEYIDVGIDSRTDAEYYEAHYISLYKTDKYYNMSKSGWGISKYLPDRENDWQEYQLVDVPIETKKYCVYGILNKEWNEYFYIGTDRFDVINNCVCNGYTGKNVRVKIILEKYNCEYNILYSNLDKDNAKELEYKTTVEYIYNGSPIVTPFNKYAPINRKIGIERAKKMGKYKGRKPVSIPNFEQHYQRYITRQINKTELARELHISRPTLDKIIKEYAIK